jgi:hypothetical protein
MIMKVRNPGILLAAAVLLVAATASYGNEGYNGGGYNGSNNYNGGDRYAGTGGSDDRDGHHGNGGYEHGNGIGELYSHDGKVGSFAVLAGGNEVSDDGKANVGDPNGRGTASVVVDVHAGKLCFAIIVDNIDAPVAAHVHKGLPGRNGPVVVALNAPHKGRHGTASGCVDNVEGKLLKAINERPGAYYVNVHTGNYPNGAVRGQLF